MIITKLQGGLGNQLFQYAIGRRFAIDGQTELKIDIDFFENQKNVTKRDFKLDAFNIQAPFATKSDKINVLGQPFFRPIKRRLWKMGLDLFRWNYIRESSFAYHPEILSKKKSVYLDGYWQCPLYFEAIRQQLVNELTLKENFISVQLSKKITEVRAVNSVAIHVRRGDYVSNPVIFQQFGLCSVDYYNDAIRYISGQVEEPEFYIFSDDILWCKENFKDLRFNIQYISDFTDFEDLILISQCKHQIISNSTFGWWGAWLNQNANKIVIAPKVWYIDPTMDTTQLIPTGWKRI